MPNSLKETGPLDNRGERKRGQESKNEQAEAVKTYVRGEGGQKEGKPALVGKGWGGKGIQDKKPDQGL